MAELRLVRPLRAALAFLLLLCSVTGAERGVVAVFVQEPDFRTVSGVAPNSPAANAGIRVGDRILAIDGKSTSQFRSVQELVSRAAGPS